MATNLDTDLAQGTIFRSPFPQRSLYMERINQAVNAVVGLMGQRGSAIPVYISEGAQPSSC